MSMIKDYLKNAPFSYLASLGGMKEIRLRKGERITSLAHVASSVVIT